MWAYPLESLKPEQLESPCLCLLSCSSGCGAADGTAAIPRRPRCAGPRLPAHTEVIWSIPRWVWSLQGPCWPCLSCVVLIFDADLRCYIPGPSRVLREEEGLWKRRPELCKRRAL